jgi:hypothetical protein
LGATGAVPAGARIELLGDYSPAREDQAWNFDPSPTRDDWTDVTLPLYAADGDLLVSEDTKLRTALSIIDPSGKVTAKGASQL